MSALRCKLSFNCEHDCNETHVVLQLSTCVHWDACCPLTVNMSALRCMLSPPVNMSALRCMYVLQLSTCVHWDACCPLTVNMSALRCMLSFTTQHECIEMHVVLQLSTWVHWDACCPSIQYFHYTALHYTFLFSLTLLLSSMLSLECFPLSLLSAKMQKGVRGQVSLVEHRVCWT